MFLFMAKRFSYCYRIRMTKTAEDNKQKNRTKKMSRLKLLIGADENKLHSNRVKPEQRLQRAVSWIDCSAEFVTQTGPSDAATSEKI